LSSKLDRLTKFRTINFQTLNPSAVNRILVSRVPHSIATLNNPIASHPMPLSPFNKRLQCDRHPAIALHWHEGNAQ
jgi:hypothetical protein